MKFHENSNANNNIDEGVEQSTERFNLFNELVENLLEPLKSTKLDNFLQLSSQHENVSDLKIKEEEKDNKLNDKLNHFENRRNMEIFKAKRFRKRFIQVIHKLENVSSDEVVSSSNGGDILTKNSVKNDSLSTSVWSAESSLHVSSKSLGETISTIRLDDDSNLSPISIYPIHLNDDSSRKLTCEISPKTKPDDITLAKDNPTNTSVWSMPTIILDEDSCSSPISIYTIHFDNYSPNRTTSEISNKTMPDKLANLLASESSLQANTE
ncbi:hypothetical protein HELRODRAFT_174597 [Helobdella robusta]|uniref:Uncharacterized protein n=1 Tax=Helobdella robusta TaxID=6412 RepID=T1F8A5_HELRO|nr:hypothetical protein HELRODRAFT_174597 [Helobdella robusta]ESO01638.1 hypothetical protein HELRODRAFT_174597 [Helobdella robusta]